VQRRRRIARSVSVRISVTAALVDTVGHTLA
jgi:hypothetical protein